MKHPQKTNQNMPNSPEYWIKHWNFDNLTHFDARGGNHARTEPKILISWSLWVSIDSALKDESIELHNDPLAPFIPVENGSSLEAISL